jgi:hypothetical protein
MDTGERREQNKIKERKKEMKDEDMKEIIFPKRLNL